MYASLCNEDELADLSLFVIVILLIYSALSAGPLASFVAQTTEYLLAQTTTDDRDRRAHDTLFPLCPRVMERWNTDHRWDFPLLFLCLFLFVMPEQHVTLSVVMFYCLTENLIQSPVSKIYFVRSFKWIRPDLSKITIVIFVLYFQLNHRSFLPF